VGAYDDRDFLHCVVNGDASTSGEEKLPLVEMRKRRIPCAVYYADCYMRRVRLPGGQSSDPPLQPRPVT
jgi:hypothetical protein